MEAACRPEAYRGGLYIVAAFENFFWQCFHLGDALWEDTSTGLSPQKVTRFIVGDPDLKYCEAMASTSKHHRRHSRQLTARVHSITPAPTGTRATIRWQQGSNTGTEDALDLARRCLAAWDRYCTKQGPPLADLTICRSTHPSLLRLQGSQHDVGSCEQLRDGRAPRPGRLSGRRSDALRGQTILTMAGMPTGSTSSMLTRSWLTWADANGVMGC